ncbi:MAG: TatD family hydrolase, partial [Kiritimatiellae bacterium]|nr:TatD family hydrolase [Kiritimatiellia bacterium]
MSQGDVVTCNPVALIWRLTEVWHKVYDMYYDTHVHFTGSAAETAAMVDRAGASAVGRMVAVGASAELNAGAIAAAAAYPGLVRLALGFDRDQAMSAATDVHVDTLRRLAAECTLAAVGETGLDFHYRPETADAQCELFAAQLRLADEWRLPVIIHTREAEEATLRMLDETPWRGEGLRGVVHCFTGDKQFAAKLLDRALAI